MEWLKGHALAKLEATAGVHVGDTFVFPAIWNCLQRLSSVSHIYEHKELATIVATFECKDIVVGEISDITTSECRVLFVDGDELLVSF